MATTEQSVNNPQWGEPTKPDCLFFAVAAIGETTQLKPKRGDHKASYFGVVHQTIEPKMDDGPRGVGVAIPDPT